MTPTPASTELKKSLLLALNNSAWSRQAKSAVLVRLNRYTQAEAALLLADLRARRAKPAPSSTASAA